MIRTTLVCGAGIGGLTAAIALAQRGVKVRVLERADALREAGAGVQLSPNAVHVVRDLGIEAAVKAVSFEPEAAVIADGLTGRTLISLPLKDACTARYGAPYLVVHRADLQAILVEAAHRAGVVIELGTTVQKYAPGPPARLLTEAGALEAELVVGADGVRSTIRAQMHSDDAIRFTGNTAWRAIVPVAGFPAGTVRPDATSWTGPGGHVVTYPLRNGSEINVVAVRERQSWTAEGWSVPGDPDVMRAAFSDWASPVRDVLAAVDRCHLWGLFDRLPFSTWRDGAVALLGDAAHPMTPFMAQGAAMAMEDGWVLAAALSKTDDMPSALKAYEAQRRRRTRRVQAMSRANMALFHRRGPVARLKLGIGAALPILAERAMSSVYGLDVTRR